MLGRLSRGPEEERVMLRQHDLVESGAMGRRMHVWRYGHYGPPMLVFPSASGMAHEWEANGMIDTLADWLNDGKLKLYCTESNVAEAWTRKDEPPHIRIKRHQDGSRTQFQRAQAVQKESIDRCFEINFMGKTNHGTILCIEF